MGRCRLPRQGDLAGEMRGLATRLGIEVAESHWRDLVDAATFRNMRARADEIAPDTTNAIWTDNNGSSTVAARDSGATFSTTPR